MKKFEKVSNQEIEKYYRLVCKVIREKLNREPTMESINVGLEAVAKALGRYDESKGTKFVTFAYVCIERQLREYWRMNRSVIDFWKNHVPMAEARHLRYEMDFEGREERRELNDRLYKEILKLPNDLQFVMLHSFGLFGREKLSQGDVAKKLGISQAWVSKIRDNAINLVAKNMNSCFSEIKWKNRNVSEAEKEAEKAIRRRGLDYKINKSIPSVVDPSTGKPF